MTRITVDLGALRTLLTNSLPFAGSDHNLPVINTVLLEGKGKWLVATATDRYIVGITRAEVATADGFRALVKVADAKHILRTFAAAKGQARDVVVALTVDDGRLVIDREDGLFADCDSLTASYVLEDGKYPGVNGLFRQWKPSIERTANGYNPQLLATFQHITNAKREPIRMSIGDGNGLTIVQAGDYFLGAIMPVRLSNESAAEDLGEWAGILAEEPAAAEPEAKPAPVKKAVAKKAPARKRAAAKVAA